MLRRSFPSVLLAVVVGLLGLFGQLVHAGAAAASDFDDEWQFVALLNQSRAAAGLPPLVVLSGLRDVSRAQSGRMESSDTLYHNPSLEADVNAVAPDWTRIGENVGEGDLVDDLHTAFMNSPAHRANILGAYNYVGIGVVHGNGRTWVTETFLQAPAGKPALAPPSPVPVTRIAGSNTSVAVAGWYAAGSAAAVVVARNDVFADALAGGPLATASHGPMLLTSPTAASPGVVDQAVRVLAPGGTVYLLGGLDALSPAVESAFTGAGLRVQRVAGDDRFETAVGVARLVNPNPSTVLVVSGATFPDAMVSGPVAALLGAPIVLTSPSGVPSASASYLASVPGAARIVVGGTAAVPAAVASAAGANDRVGGVDRYDTSVRVAQRWFAGVQKVSFATGSSFQDALAGTPFSALAGIPLVLVSNAPGSTTTTFVRSLSLQGTIVYGSAVSDTAIGELLA